MMRRHIMQRMRYIHYVCSLTLRHDLNESAKLCRRMRAELLEPNYKDHSCVWRCQSYGLYRRVQSSVIALSKDAKKIGEEFDHHDMCAVINK